MLRLQAVQAVIEGLTIVSGASLQVETGALAGLIGPNGSGKSTLLRCVYRALRPHSGMISLDDDDLWSLSPRQAAQRTGVVLQEPAAEFDLRAWEVVMSGRIPHKSPLEGDSDRDQDLVDRALARVGMSDFADRWFGTLSGGEKQRVLVARALAQGSRLVVMDEPTNHLDVRYQLEIMSLVSSLGLSALVAIHDLNLAAAFCDRLFLLSEGRVVASGSPRQVLRPETVATVFGVGVRVMEDPVTERLNLSFFIEDHPRVDGRPPGDEPPV